MSVEVLLVQLLSIDSFKEVNIIRISEGNAVFAMLFSEDKKDTSFKNGC